MEVWLRTNVRALMAGMVPPSVVGIGGIVLVLGLPDRPSPFWLRVVGAALAAISLVAIVALAWEMRKPRLAYQDGELLVRLRAGPPVQVPIEIVEGFLLGQAPSLLPGKQHRRSETATLVIRLADRATEWHRVEVKPQLGKWCEGYVTIRGTWCEPLSLGLVKRLNERLAEVSRAAPRSSG
jgi:hypothetical protein